MLHQLARMIYDALKGDDVRARALDLLEHSTIRWPGITRIRIFEKRVDGSKAEYLVTITEVMRNVHLHPSPDNRRSLPHTPVQHKGRVRRRARQTDKDQR